MYETSFERQKAMDDTATSVMSFLSRMNSIPGEITRYQSDLAASVSRMEAAKTACDALVLADPQNAALLAEQSILSAKSLEIVAIKAQADALGEAIQQVLSR